MVVDKLRLVRMHRGRRTWFHRLSMTTLAKACGQCDYILSLPILIQEFN